VEEAEDGHAGGGQLGTGQGGRRRAGGACAELESCMCSRVRGWRAGAVVHTLVPCAAECTSLSMALAVLVTDVCFWRGDPHRSEYDAWRLLLVSTDVLQ
jgi:hypothetical protein